MCRSIKVLRNAEQRATVEEVSAAALQFVRKISGFHKPSRANREAFERAVQEITESSYQLLQAVSMSSGSGGQARPVSPSGELQAGHEALASRHGIE
jgi:hypothetical protein